MDDIELLANIVKKMVSKPEQVNIVIKDDNKLVKFGIQTAREDIGKIVGRKGRTLEALKTIMNNITMKNNNKNAIVYIIED